MFSSMFSSCKKRWRHRLGEKAAFFFFIGLAATVVVLALVWQLTFSGSGGGVGLSGAIDDWRLKQLLPAGADVGPAGIVGLDLPPGASVVGYGSQSRSFLALIVPGEGGKLAVANTLDLTQLDPTFSGTPHVVARIIGPGASPAVIARVKGNFDAYAVIFAVVDNGRLRPLVMQDGGGNIRLAIFYHGYVSEGQEEFSLEDVDGDGREEAVTRGRYVVYGDGSSGYNTSASVYRLEDGKWVFNRDLSWALTARNGLFPEPPGADDGFPDGRETESDISGIDD
jgi:hypothetical protein